VFTGIVEEIGIVEAIDPLDQASRIRIRGPIVTSDVQPGDSISVNGVCLTVVDPAEGTFAADVMAETLSRSSLAAIEVGAAVNLERAARVDSRLGGHIVQGHVDGIGHISGIQQQENWTLMTIELPHELSRYLVEKGSITVDGVSLTVVSVTPHEFVISLIPTTLAETTLGSKSTGDTVNLEVDVIAKYVEKMLEGRVG
jgi:riboflavin synthase